MDRVQRKRVKGFRLPPHTLCVNRRTAFGSPFYIRKSIIPGALAVFDGDISFQTCWSEEGAHRLSVEFFRQWINKPEQAILRELFLQTCEASGIEHLACFCHPALACHVDVWREIWNKHIEHAF